MAFRRDAISHSASSQLTGANARTADAFERRGHPVGVADYIGSRHAFDAQVTPRKNVIGIRFDLDDNIVLYRREQPALGIANLAMGANFDGFPHG